MTDRHVTGAANINHFVPSAGHSFYIVVILSWGQIKVMYVNFLIIYTPSVCLYQAVSPPMNLKITV